MLTPCSSSSSCTRSRSRKSTATWRHTSSDPEKVLRVGALPRLRAQDSSRRRHHPGSGRERPGNRGDRRRRTRSTCTASPTFASSSFVRASRRTTSSNGLPTEATDRPQSSDERALLAFGLLLASAPAAQQPSAPQPTFRSGVELLRLPVTVVDGKGQPLRDLAPSEFSVKVDGRDRKLLFAHFFGPPAEGRAAAAVPPPAPTYAMNTTSAAGRVVVFAVDLIEHQAGLRENHPRHGSRARRRARANRCGRADAHSGSRRGDDARSRAGVRCPAHAARHDRRLVHQPLLHDQRGGRLRAAQSPGHRRDHRARVLPLVQCLPERLARRDA